MGANQSNPISYERHGNLIYCYLQQSGGKRKLIGVINESTRTLTKRISQQLHTFNKSNSIAIAYELLKLDFDFIIIECGYNTYKTTRKYFLEHSTFKKFSGYELQKFLPIELFGIEQAESWRMSQDSVSVPVSINPGHNVLQLEMFK